MAQLFLVRRYSSRRAFAFSTRFSLRGRHSAWWIVFSLCHFSEPAMGVRILGASGILDDRPVWRRLGSPEADHGRSWPFILPSHLSCAGSLSDPLSGSWDWTVAPASYRTVGHEKRLWL